MRARIKWILEDTEEPFAIVAQECELLGKRIGHVLHGFFFSGKHHPDEHIRIAWVWVFVRHLSSPSSRVPVVPIVQSLCSVQTVLEVSIVLASDSRPPPYSRG